MDSTKALTRKAVAAAIFDPGATEGFKGDRTLTEWQTDAVMRALAALAEQGEAPQPIGSEYELAETVHGEIVRVVRKKPNNLKEPIGSDTCLDGRVLAWLHEITEPDGQQNRLLSFSPDNPWSHWMEMHRDKCVYKATALYVARPKSGSDQ